MFSLSLESNIVPFFASIKAQDEGDAKKTITRLFTFSISVSICLTVFMLFASRYILQIVTAFPEKMNELVFMIFLELSPIIALSVLSGY